MRLLPYLHLLPDAHRVRVARRDELLQDLVVLRGATKDADTASGGRGKQELSVQTVDVWRRRISNAAVLSGLHHQEQAPAAEKWHVARRWRSASH